MEKKKTKKEEDKKISSNSIKLLGELIEKKKKAARKPFLYFVREGLAIPVWTIISIEKDVHWIANPVSHSVWDIILNKGRETDRDCPLGEKVFSYNKEEKRDEDFEIIMEIFNKNIYNVIKIEKDK